MPGRPRVPVSVRRCVRAIAQTDGDVPRAFAICVAQGQKRGDIKPGTITPTAQGKKRSKRKSSEKGAGAKAAEYEKLLAGARAEESLGALVAHGFALLEQSDEDDAEAESLAALDGDVWGDLQVSVMVPVGKASDDTRRAALKLLKRYQANFHGGLGGTSVWSVSSMRVRYRAVDRAVELELWINIQNYPGMRVLSDLVQQVSDAALELSQSMMPKDAKDLLGSVTPAVVTAEPVEFVQSS
jgi:hypothetical protein